jgi:hypothetical protein
LSDLFGKPLTVSGGFLTVQVTNGTGVVGFELITVPDPPTIMGLNPWLDFGAKELFSAQLAQIPGDFFTDLKLLNTSSSQRSVRLTVIGDTGDNLAPPVSIQIPGSGAFEKSIDEVFPTVSFPAGSLHASADGDGVIGDVIFGDPAGLRYAAALSLQTQGFTQAVFSQVVNTSAMYTGVALFNPGTAPADVQLLIFDSGGNQTGTASVTIPGGGRLSRTLDQLAPATNGQEKGYTVVRSSQPVIAQQVFGDGANLLSAIPPTVVH